MTNTSIMLIETIFIVHRRELSSFRGKRESVSLRRDETVSNSHVQRKKNEAGVILKSWLTFLHILLAHFILYKKLFHMAPGLLPSDLLPV